MRNVWEARCETPIQTGKQYQAVIPVDSMDRGSSPGATSAVPEPSEQHRDVLERLTTVLLQERVLGIALRVTRNREDAEDVRQETLLKVHRKLDQFSGRSSF